jgi:Uma2 family endonuclease
MSTHTAPQTIVYPDSDGLPLAENTLQFEWITKIVGGLDALYRGNPNVFVAGDLFWYPVEGDNKTRTAPDALVAFGRPKGHRGSYMQWCEGGIAPQVVFEVLSPGNRAGEMAAKRAFYDRFGVEEYYVIDPDLIRLEGWRRVDGSLQAIDQMNGWASPRLSIRFELHDGDVRVLDPDGKSFETYAEMAGRAERLLKKLRNLGVDPDA